MEKERQRDTQSLDTVRGQSCGATLCPSSALPDESLPSPSGEEEAQGGRGTHTAHLLPGLGLYGHTVPSLAAWPGVALRSSLSFQSH